MSIWATFLSNLFPSRFNTKAPNLSAILGAVGETLDGVDPAQSGSQGSGTISMPFIGSQLVYTSPGVYYAQYLLNEYDGQLMVWFDGQLWNVFADGTVLSASYNFDSGNHVAVLTWGSGKVTLTIDGTIVVTGAANVPERVGSLANQFSVSGASGPFLDLNGEDWGVTRRTGESDSSYRARILAVIPAYAQGPTIPALIGTVKPFTGVAPLVYAATQYSKLFPLTFPLIFGGNTTQDYFTIRLTIQNPNNVSYQRQDVIDAIDNVKRVIATVVVTWEDGTTTTVQ